MASDISRECNLQPKVFLIRRLQIGLGSGLAFDWTTDGIRHDQYIEVAGPTRNHFFVLVSGLNGGGSRKEGGVDAAKGPNLYNILHVFTC